MTAPLPRLLVALVVSAAVVTGARPAASAPDPTGAVALRLVGPDGAPIADASILLEGPGGSFDLVTEGDGLARATDLAPGRYSVLALPPGFEPITATVTVVAGRERQRTLRAATAAMAEEVVLEGEAPERPRELRRQELDRDQLRTSAGTNGDALLAVQNLPGVARPPAMGAGGLVVRGAGPDDTAIFVDGTPIPLAFHFGGLNSVIPSEALDRLVFVPGNIGPAYGRALGGVVDLRLRSPRRDRAAGLAQIDAFDGRIFVESPLGKRVRFLAGARRSWVDAWIGPVLEETGNAVTTAPAYYDGQALVEADLGASTTARLAVFGASDRFRLVLSSPSAMDPAPGQLGLGSDFWRVQARAETAVDRLRWTSTLAVGKELRDLRFGTTFIGIDVAVLAARSEIDAQLSPRLAVTAGVDLDLQRGDIDLRAVPSADGAPPAPSFGRPPVIFSTTAGFARPAAYAGLEWLPRRDVELYPSLRVDYTSDGSDVTASPRLNGRWRLTDDGAAAIEAGAGIYFQPPPPGRAIAPFGNPRLENGRALQMSVGASRRFGAQTSVEVSWYGKRLSQLPVARETAGSGVSGTTIENAGSGSVWGVEILARGGLGDVAAGSVAYTFARSRRRDGPGEPLAPYELDQPHTLTVLGSTALGRWTLGGRFRLSSGTPDTPYLGGVVDLDAGAYGAVPGARASRRLPPFHQLDLRVERRFGQRPALVAYLDVQNVYNRANPVGLAYSYDYTESQPVSGLPIVPVVGLRGEL